MYRTTQPEEREDLVNTNGQLIPRVCINRELQTHDQPRPLRERVRPHKDGNKQGEDRDSEDFGRVGVLRDEHERCVILVMDSVNVLVEPPVLVMRFMPEKK